ncbi:MAG: ribonuclease domain-containing protein [Pseudomonadota bacterium]
MGHAAATAGATAGVTAGLLIATLTAPQALEARTLQDPSAAASFPSVQLAALPPEAQATERLIRAGGPFPYAKDGSVFGNRERLLPRKPRGFYREYTVKTPGARNRGARRIVCGGQPPTRPEACYYTDDHYASFRRIVQ